MVNELNTNANSNERLLTSGFPAHDFTREERVKGGKSRSNAKRFNATINGLLARQDLTKEQKTHLALLRNGEFFEILKAHFARDLIYAEDLEERGARDEAFRVRQVLAQKILKVIEIVVQREKPEQPPRRNIAKEIIDAVLKEGDSRRN